MLKDICEEYKLSLTQATIISFLHHSPKKGTAADTAQLQMLLKGIVPQSVSYCGVNRIEPTEVKFICPSRLPSKQLPNP